MSEVKLAGGARGSSQRRGFALPFWAFLVVVVAAAAGAGLALKSQEQGFLADMMATESDLRMELLISASVEDIISEDVPRLETILEQVMANDPDVNSIRISDEDDKLLVSQNKAAGGQSVGGLPFGDASFAIRRLVKDVRFEGDSYGRMAVELNTRRSGVLIEQHAYKVAAAVAIVGLLFGLLGYWLGRSRA